MALVLLNTIGNLCAATWNWVRSAVTENTQDEPPPAPNLSRRATIGMSQSLPNLPTESPRGLRNRNRTRGGSERGRQSFKHKPQIPRTPSFDSSSTYEYQTAGVLNFSLVYDHDLEGLVVTIHEARDLPMRNITGSIDPYIRVCLMPNKSRVYQTRIHRRTTNPIFNETFVFSVDYEELPHRYLQFSVLDFDRFRRLDLLGQVLVRGLFSELDLQRRMDFAMNFHSPLPAAHDCDQTGEILLSLCYLPSAGRLSVTIIKAHNLKQTDDPSTVDPYVKVCLICEERRLKKKKKTSVHRSTLAPTFNENLTFNVSQEDIQNVYLVVKVFNRNRIGPSELLGCTGIGNNFMGVGRSHWQEMLDKPRSTVTRVYTLLDHLPGRPAEAEAEAEAEEDEQSVEARSVNCLTRR